MSEIVDLDLDDDDDMCHMLEVYLKDNLSEPSFEVFGEIASEVGLDLEALYVAAGKAVLNEAIIKIIEDGVAADAVNKLTMHLLQCDMPSPITGRIYPREEIENAIAKYQETIDKDVAFGTLGPATPTMNIVDISHKVKNITINEDGSVVADIEILDTPQGTFVQSLGIDYFRLSPCLSGQVIDDNVVSECTLLHTALLHKEKETDE